MRIFNVARIPRPGCDAFSEPAPPGEPATRTILCMVRDWMYAIEVIDRDGRPLSPAALETSIVNVVKDVGRRAADGEQVVPVSVLSADHRDQWAKVRSSLWLYAISLTALHRTARIY